jgi:hypothetical protein
MTNKKTILLPLVALTILLLSGWGHTGHFHISQRASLSFNEHMAAFDQWTAILAAHASDADERKSIDPNESPRHYIDIDNYPVFNQTGRIPQTLDSVVALYGSYFVYEQGVLPWATLRTFDSLVACFGRYDWEKAVLFAADLGHYVADGHMPMHITRNYNGQFTGNNGIHSRYESTMINAYIPQITYEGSPAEIVENVPEYVFGYIYQNYLYVDSVLLADDYAKSVSGNTGSQAYKQALWEYSNGFTTHLFKSASHALAELIYTAWVHAGSPELGSSSIADPLVVQGILLRQNTPNPFATSTSITFELLDQKDISIEIYNATGQLIGIPAHGSYAAGSHQLRWQPSENQSGIYYLVLTSPQGRQMRKMVMQ